MRALPTGRILEVGCGAGALLEDLCRLGFECDALETSPRALRIAREILKPWPTAHLHEHPDADWTERFDAILSFDVLEHIADDRAALAQWASWLRPGGLAIMSVPAHVARWAPDDEWAGHFRRYERADLVRLFDAVGLRVVRIRNYGFPLGNLVGLFRRSVHAAELQAGPTEIGERTARSGVERSTELRLWPIVSSLPGVLAMNTGMALQQLFLSGELGDGYLIVGCRR
jgi:SAM-dependent methyltransferase